MHGPVYFWYGFIIAGEEGNMGRVLHGNATTPATKRLSDTRYSDRT